MILNIEYCGNCNGSCQGCVLSQEERSSNKPFLDQFKISLVIGQIAETWTPQDFLAVGIGRGNCLTMPLDNIDDFWLIASLVRKKLPAKEVVYEVSTSLIGKLDQQVERAKLITDAIQSAHPGAVVRFACVINPSLHSRGYWTLIESFFDTMSKWRGEGDGAGDIAILNIDSDKLPVIPDLIKKISQWRWPVNVVWVGIGQKKEGGLSIRETSQWFSDFATAAAENGMDCSLNTRRDMAIARAKNESGSLASETMMRDDVLFVDHAGVISNGCFTIFGDLDSTRFPALKEIESPATIVRKMMRHPVCRNCPVIRECVAAGGHKMFAINQSKCLSEPNKAEAVCLSGLKEFFSETHTQIA